MKTFYDSHILIFALGLVIGMWGPPLLAWMITIGEQPPPGRTTQLRDLLHEEPPKICGPRRRGRHGHHRVR